MANGQVSEAEGLSARQRDVLDAVLGLVTRSQKAPTMTDVAKAASCSKETLYRWFGDRDGLLTATVRWQAAKVRGVALPESAIDLSFLSGELKRFAADWLTVISSETSVALNRLAIAEAGSQTLDLGAIVLKNGPSAMARRLDPLLEAAKAAGLIAYESKAEAFSIFFGLVVGDRQIRLLLGEQIALSPGAIDRAASQAALRFIALFGLNEPPHDHAGQN